MTALICAAIIAAGYGAIYLQQWGVANTMERAGLRLLEGAAARRRRHAKHAAENETRSAKWASARMGEAR